MTALNEQLLKAAKDGNFTRVKELFENGADINAKDDNGNTALYESAGKGHTDVVRLLLENGANIHAKKKS